MKESHTILCSLKIINRKNCNTLRARIGKYLIQQQFIYTAYQNFYPCTLETHVQNILDDSPAQLVQSTAYPRYGYRLIDLIFVSSTAMHLSEITCTR